ncbi:MAG TPA: cytochrome c biogenesis protein CcsA, partial [Dehalococcoidia bacterium]|nr:cytochrome c biogenesis protein CcsA [Dehalococcoidia bacterium]
MIDQAGSPPTTPRPESIDRRPPTNPGPRAAAPGRGVGRLGWTALSAMLVALGMIFFYAPTERVQGDVQRIFYLHLGLAWVGFLAFFVVFVASIGYLWKRTSGWDVWARSSAEVGVVYMTLVLITGSIWAKPVWGTWWTWDARLTTTLILWLIYLAYLVVRAYASEPGRAARYAAVIGIIGFLDVPIVYQSVNWWRTLHPGPTVVQSGGGSGLTPAMMATLLVTLVAFTVLYLYLTRLKAGIERAKDALLA